MNFLAWLQTLPLGRPLKGAEALAADAAWKAGVRAGQVSLLLRLEKEKERSS